MANRRNQFAEIKIMAKTYNFDENGGKFDIDGKVFYPNHLHIFIKDKYHALRIAETILRQVCDDRSEEFDLQITLFGEFKIDNE